MIEKKTEKKNNISQMELQLGDIFFCFLSFLFYAIKKKKNGDSMSIFIVSYIFSVKRPYNLDEFIVNRSIILWNQLFVTKILITICIELNLGKIFLFIFPIDDEQMGSLLSRWFRELYRINLDFLYDRYALGRYENRRYL